MDKNFDWKENIFTDGSEFNISWICLRKIPKFFFDRFLKSDYNCLRSYVILVKERKVKIMAKVLIVDDAEFMRGILKKILLAYGHEIVGEAADANSGIEKYKLLKPDLCTMDICMPDKSGIEAIKEIVEFDSKAKIIVCSSLGQEILVMEAIQVGAKDFVVKPFKKEKLMETIKQVLSE